MSSSTKNKIVLKKLKDTDNVWHSESTLVFKSSKDKVVIGRYSEKEIIPLDDVCLELCSKWKFKYDKDLVEVEEDEDEEENVDENLDVNGDEDLNGNGDENDEQEEVGPEIVHIKDESDKEYQSQEDIIVHEIKKDNTKSQHINYKQAYLTDITSDFSKKIYNYFDSVNQKYNEDLLNLKNDISAKDKIHSDLLKEHESVKQELKNLKTKFEGIKQLFSL